MKTTTKDFINRSNQVHGDKYDYSLVEYSGSHNKVKIICPIHGIFEQKSYLHLQKQGCPKCVGKHKTNEDFTNKSNKTHNNFYDYSLVEYINAKVKVKIICPVHGVFEQTPDVHLRGFGCSVCSNNKKLSQIEFIEICSNKHNNKYDYSLVEYKNNLSKIKIICPIHGVFEQISKLHKNGCGCPICNDSKGEKEILHFLNKYKILSEKQKTFDGCKDKQLLLFDFYLPETNTCIEFDGKQHFISVKKWGGDIGLSERIRRDNIKNEYCINNNINLIRIKYNENINTKLKNNLLK